MDYDPIPTVVPAEPLDVEADTTNLRAAMKGFGTDEQTIIDIITARSNAQRQLIKENFLREYGRDLIDDLKSELGGKFEDAIIALMMPPVKYLCTQLHRAMAGMGTNESTLVEILCTKSNEEMVEIVKCYEDMYDRPLAEHMCSETSGHFRRLLTLIVTGVRDPVGAVDAQKAVEQAQQLYSAGEAKLGTDEEVFNRILAHGSFAQLRLVFDDYKQLSGQTIEQAIKHEMSGELHEAMMAIVECVQSPPAFFANRLFKAMDGMGTDDNTLIRIIVSRSEIDLGNIKDEFERIYNRTLVSAVKSETSGDYKRALCALIE
ncbi:annexin B10 isoform X1 [Stomoxys calcitrans]|uniref:Annexin n=1 Tax=Stomoxys calcitrans TaxID=35570 RepID=A0A1I8PPC2_STOCA|nr:annexin B10 isoform X1 [Stomoxys calcitrans]